MTQNTAKDLLTFIRNSPSCYHVVANFETMLQSQGFQKLEEQEKWMLKAGGQYYVTRNQSSIIAFRIPQAPEGGFMISAAHSDSPTYKIKDNPENVSAGHYIRLSTEKYGASLMAPWADRPLSVAGRVTALVDGAIETRLVNIDRDLLIIPNVAIHMNRAANDGVKLSAAVDTIPLLGSLSCKDTFMQLVAESAGVKAEDILGHDLFLYVRQPGVVFGGKEEFIASPKLDDLECAYGCMKGLINAKDSRNIQVCCVFDNEEVGSHTKQGGASFFMRDTLERIATDLGRNTEDFKRMLAESFLISADNAHAQHPNHPEYADANNCPYMNEGIVIKFNAKQKYATDGIACAVFRSVCKDANVPVQVFANRSDMEGGSTLGSLADVMVPVSTADIGLAQLAMHSCYETAGVQDLSWLVDAMTCYYNKTLRRSGNAITLS